MTTRLGRLIALVAACAAVALAASASAAYAAEGPCSNITGSGSSLQRVLQQNVWIPGFESQPSHSPVKCSGTAPKVVYVATSTGRGKACWGSSGTDTLTECGTSGTLDDYIDGDVAPEGPSTTPGTQLHNMDEANHQGTAAGEGIVAVPVAQSAVAVIVSMPLGCTPTEQSNPRVDAKALDIQWKLNQVKLHIEIRRPQWQFCLQIKLFPTLFARSKSSGTTAGFKRFLDQVNHIQWSGFVSTAAKAENTEWPTAAGIQTVSSTGLEEAENVFRNPNSMGYADLADARAAGFTQKPTPHTVGQSKFYSFFVEVQNKEGEAPTYASPEVEEAASPQFEGSNCKEALYETAGLKVAGNVDWSGARQINELKGKAGSPYPICTLTFDNAFKKYMSAGLTEGAADTTLDYLSYIVNQGQTVTGIDKEHYAPLPTELDETAKEGVSKTNIGF
jgi:hypothetical protein